MEILKKKHAELEGQANKIREHMKEHKKPDGSVDKEYNEHLRGLKKVFSKQDKHSREIQSLGGERPKY